MTKIEKVIKNQQIFRTKDNKTRQKNLKTTKQPKERERKRALLFYWFLAINYNIFWANCLYLLIKF